MTKKIVSQREIGASARTSKTAAPANWKFPLEKMNFIIIGVGVIFIVVGYLLMGTGVTTDPALAEGAKWNSPLAIVVAPIVLMLGYCAIIPYGILKRFSGKKQQEEA